jgi:hypothetical protein
VNLRRCNFPHCVIIKAGKIDRKEFSIVSYTTPERHDAAVTTKVIVDDVAVKLVVRQTRLSV